MRDHGESPVDSNPTTEITVECYIEDIVAVVDELKLDSVHFCGVDYSFP